MATTMLECAECHSRVPEDSGDGKEGGAGAPATRCPKCGGRLLAPPGLLDRRSVLVGTYVAGGALMAAVGFAYWGVYFLYFIDRALAFFGLSPLQSGAAERRDRLYDIVRDAERSVPAYPGAARLRERIDDNRAGTAPAMDVCWQAPGAPDDVLAFYRQALPAQQWRIRRETRDSGQLSAERGQVRLLLHDPADGAVAGLECPPDTTHVLSFTAFNVRRGG